MRYLVRARVKPGQAEPLLRAIAEETLGRGSIAGAEYQHDMTFLAQLRAKGREQ